MRAMLGEDFLQYVWGQRLYGSEVQTTTEGETIEILNPGWHNSDAGPDFFNAQVRIGVMTWAGNVEVHTTSDEWYRHGHDHDAAYDNVILHVVGRSTGSAILNSKGEPIPEMVLAYPKDLEAKAEALTSGWARGAIGCAAEIANVEQVVRTLWLESMLVERLETRCSKVSQMLEVAKGDKDQAFFSLLARAMGGKVNSEPMEMMAMRTPVKALIKHPGALQSEALMLGQSGLLGALEGDDDAYVALMKREYSLLSVKFGLEPLPDASVWKYLRLRPANFPDVRLVELAAVVRAIPGNFEAALSSDDVLHLERRLEVEASEYWDSHYRIGKEASKRMKKKVGDQMRRSIIVNAVVPFLYECAKRRGDYDRQAAVVGMLRAMEVERNAVLDQWTEAGVEPSDEGEAQALLHVSKEYCQRGRCLHCKIGHSIVGKTHKMRRLQ